MRQYRLETSVYQSTLHGTVEHAGEIKSSNGLRKLGKAVREAHVAAYPDRQGHEDIIRIYNADGGLVARSYPDGSILRARR